MNRKTNRSLVIVSLLAVFAMILGACTPAVTPTAAPVQPTGPTPTVKPAANAAQVGVVLPTKDEPRWLQDQAVFQKAGYEPLFSQGDSAKEKANVETLISQGIKVLIICPQDATAAAAAAEEAKAAGIKVISYDRLIRDTDAVDYYVTFDSFAVGASWGQYLIEKAGATKGNNLYLYAGAASDNNAFIFFEGAWETLQPKIADGTFVIKNSSEAVAAQGKATLTRDEESKIIGQITTNWDFNTAKNLAESNLTVAQAADKGTVYIVAPNDGTARAIADAFAADKEVTQYYITGQDAEKASVQYIIDGKQSMTVFKDVRTLAADAVSAAQAFLSGNTPEKTNSYNNGKVDVPAKPSAIVVVTKDNVQSALIDSGYYQASDFTGLGSGAAPAAGTVGVVLPTKDEPRWLQDQAVFQKAGYEPLFSQGDSAKEKANVETLISQGIKVLIICPQDATAAAAAAEEAKAAGIKVISYDRLIRDTDAVDYYVTFDSFAVGASWGQYLIEKAGATKGNNLYLYAGAASDNNAFIFFEGAWETLQPKIADGTFVIKNSSEAVAAQGKATLTRDEEAKIIGQITTNWDFNTAKNLAESNLTVAQAADKGTVYIVAPNDGTARAIADAFAADKEVTQYYITGQDAEKASVQYIIDGKQSMTVFKDVRTLAADAVSAAQAFLSGNTPVKTNSYNNGKVDVPAKPSAIVVVTKDNVQSALIDSGYYQASDFTGLGSGAAPAAGTVGVVLPTKDEPRWLQDQAVFQKAGYEPLFSQGDSAKEKANVETLISQGIKVLIICPQDATAAAAAAEEAKAAGIKVISYDRLIRDTDAVDYYVTFDSFAVGAAWSQFLIEKAGATKGNNLYLYAGAASDNNAFIFFEGAWETIQPKIADGTFVIKNSSEAVAAQGKATLTRDEEAKIIGQITTNWDFNTAKNLAESNLTVAQAADKGTVYIVAPNDGTARAIADAFAADKEVTQYYITGQDAEKASVQYIIDGKQSMTVFKDVRTLAADAVSAAQAFLSGNTPVKTNSYNNGKVDVPAKPSAIVVVTKDNVKSALIDSGYYQASDFTGLP